MTWLGRNQAALDRYGRHSMKKRGKDSTIGRLTDPSQLNVSMVSIQNGLAWSNFGARCCSGSLYTLYSWKWFSSIFQRNGLLCWASFFLRSFTTRFCNCLPPLLRTLGRIPGTPVEYFGRADAARCWSSTSSWQQMFPFDRTNRLTQRLAPTGLLIMRSVYTTELGESWRKPYDTQSTSNIWISVCTEPYLKTAHWM